MCCIASTPVEDKNGRIKVYLEGQTFKTSMLKAPFSSCISFLYFAGQMIPCTMGINIFIKKIIK